MPASPARAASFDILLRVERDSAYTSELLHSAKYGRLSTADHALTTELVMGVLRWRSRLDDEIAETSSQPISKLDLEILIALRLALYQLRWLDRIPPRAAIHEGVELVKRARKRSAAPFLNAILRKLAAKSQSSRDTSHTLESADSPEALARAYAHPRWLVDRWTKDYGLLAARQVCEYNQSIPTTTIRLRDPEIEAELAKQGIQLASPTLLASARRIQSGDISKTRAFREGRVVIQDEASQLVAALVGHGSQILDCCAAPGGKTRAMADRNPDASVTAVELHPHRARLLQTMLDPHKNLPGQEQSGNITILVADVRALPARSLFDRVLADVPCSGTGTLARNPEIKWRLTPDDLPELQASSRRTPHLLNLFAGKRRKRGCSRSSLGRQRIFQFAGLPHRTSSPEGRGRIDLVGSLLTHARPLPAHSSRHSALRRLLRRDPGARLEGNDTLTALSEEPIR